MALIMTLVQPQVDLGLKLPDRPAVCDRLRRIPGVEVWVFAVRVEQHLVMGPAYLCRQRLHFFGVGPHRGKPPHVEQVAPRETARRPGVRGKILRDPPNYVIAPAASLLLVENLPADRPLLIHALSYAHARSLPTPAIYRGGPRRMHHAMKVSFRSSPWSIHDRLYSVSSIRPILTSPQV